MEETNKIKIEKGDHFLAINPETNTVYVSNNKSNSILVIDGSSNKVVDRIEIQRPRKLVINSNSQRLCAISGKAGFLNGGDTKQISVIDICSNKIIKTIVENDDFLDIEVNPKTNLLYAIRIGSVEVDIFDSSSISFVGNIGAGRYLSCLSVDLYKNKIYLGKYADGYRKLSVDVIDGDSKTLEQTFTGSRNYGSGGTTIDEIYINSKSNAAYLVGHSYSDRGEHQSPFLSRLNERTNQIEKSNLKFSNEDGVAFDQSRNRIYSSNTKKRKVLIFDENLEEIGSVPYAPEWKGFWQKFTKGGAYFKRDLVINPTTSKIFVIGVDEDKDDCLYILKN